MSKLLFWALDALSLREPTPRLADGALDVLEKLSVAGWRHVVVADEAAGADALERLGVAGRVAWFFDGAPIAEAVEAMRPFDEAFVIGSSVPRHIMPAREASLPSILVGDASPFAQFCAEQAADVPDALATWTITRKNLLL
jgi:phosphoglycolate phosphatase-like HAD superfamily hydrolase